MKIEIDMTEIFENEDGGDIKMTVGDRVIENVTNRAWSDFERRFKERLDSTLTKMIEEKVSAKLDEVIPQMLEHEFTEITSWGSVKEKWSVKGRILAAIEKTSQYNNSSSWDSDKNAFTKAINSIVSEHVKQFDKIIRDTINFRFRDECIKVAQERLKDQFTK